MGIYNLGESIRGFYKGEKGAGGGVQGLSVIAASSAFFAFLFQVLSIDDIRAKEREVHYENGHRMMKAVVQQIDNSLGADTGINTKATITALFNDLETLLAYELTADNKLGKFALSEIASIGVLEQAPDPTRTRLDLEPVNYDQSNTKLELVNVDGAWGAVVDVVGVSSATGYEDPAARPGDAAAFHYIKMIGAEAEDYSNAGDDSVESIDDMLFDITKINIQDA
jgi:hypothetical protein